MSTQPQTATALDLEPREVEATLQPLERATMLPPRAFVDPGVFEWELETIFSGWICVGHVSRVAEPGSYLMREIGTDSVVVMGAEDGRPRAFLNVCRHRGARLIDEPEGSVRRRIQCPYHGWSYGLDGQLKATPHMEGVEDFDTSCWGLMPVRVATVGGLVLVDLSGEAPDVGDHAGELAGYLERYRVEALGRAGQASYEVAANWKAIAENYSECLHCPGVHPELNRLSHYMSGEVLDGAGAWCGGSMTLTEGASTMGREGGHAQHRPPIDGLSGADLSSVLYFVLFPNTLVSLHPDYAMLHTLVAALGRSHRRGLRVVLRACDDRRPGLRPLGRDRILGPGQPRGLARLRAHREGGAQPRLRGRPLLGRGGRRARLRLDGRRPVHGCPARPRAGAGVNEIAAKLGEVGLPEPVAELAKRDWDAIVVGGGHNGLTAAAYLARAGRSVLVLERRERLGGACTLERPFSDERYVVSPCAYVVGLLDDLVIRELELERRGLRYWMADPNLWVPFDDGTAFGQWLDDERTQTNLEQLGVSPSDIEGYWAYEELFDEARRKLRQGSRDTWVGDAPSRDEIEELLDGNPG